MLYDDNGDPIDTTSDFVGPIDTSGNSDNSGGPSLWTPAVIASFVHDGEGIASAWYTAQTGRPVVTPGTSPAFTNQQLSAYAGSQLANSSPAAVYGGSSILSSNGSGLILLAVAALVVVVLAAKA